jgi:hypothetical protein
LFFPWLTFRGIVLVKVCLGGLFIEGLSLSLFNGQSTNRAFSHAGSQTIAKRIADHSRLSIDQLYGTLGTGDNAITAAITEGLVYFYNIS